MTPGIMPGLNHTPHAQPGSGQFTKTRSTTTLACITTVSPQQFTDMGRLCLGAVAQPWPTTSQASLVPFPPSQTSLASSPAYGWPGDGKIPIKLDPGPSPELGSGQERFRQLVFTPASRTSNPNETTDQAVKTQSVSRQVTPHPMALQGSSHYCRSRRLTLARDTPHCTASSHGDGLGPH